MRLLSVRSSDSPALRRDGYRARPVLDALKTGLAADRPPGGPGAKKRVFRLVSFG